MTDAKRCARANNCVAREEVDGAWVGGEATRDLCGGCEGAVADTLHEAPDLYDRLRGLARQRGQTTTGEHVKSSRGGSFGLNGHPLYLAETLAWTLTGWMDEVAATAERPAVDRASQPEREQVTDACLFLAAYLPVWLAHAPVEFQVTRSNSDPDDPKAEPSLETVCVQQAGWQACAWLVDWHRTAERTLGVTRLTHYPPEPCPNCDVPRVLRRRDGSDKVECTNCGKTWTLDHYETFVHAWLGGAPAEPPSQHHGPSAALDGHDARVGSREIGAA